MLEEEAAIALMDNNTQQNVQLADVSRSNAGTLQSQARSLGIALEGFRLDGKPVLDLSALAGGMEPAPMPDAAVDSMTPETASASPSDPWAGDRPVSVPAAPEAGADAERPAPVSEVAAYFEAEKDPGVTARSYDFAVGQEDEDWSTF